MSRYSGLRDLGKVILHLENRIDDAVITILIHEQREEIARLLVKGLADSQPNPDIKIETSSGEYTDQIATVKVNGNKYTISMDHLETYISAINYYTCRITADTRGILVFHKDHPGVVYDITRVLAEYKINISRLHVSREQKGRNALLVSMTDEEIPAPVLSRIQQLAQVQQVVSLDANRS